MFHPCGLHDYWELVVGTCSYMHMPFSNTMTRRAILHDENRYADADTFNPSRFLTSKGELDQHVPDPIEAFGYARRVCPGRHFAADSLWLTSASILAAFVIEKPIDELGNVIEPNAEYTPGVFR